MPAFEVYAFRGVATSDPSTYSDLSRESVTEDRVASSDPPQHVSTSVHRHLAERGGLVSSEEDMAVGLDAKKKVAEEGSVIASGYHFDFQNLSYIKLHHLESENVQIMSSLQSGTNLPLPAANHQVFVMPSKELTRSQNALPSFIQQLVVSNVQDSAGNTSGACLDIPQSFLKAHNTQLQAHVKLQGIREESPSCIVTCSDDNTFHGGEPSSSSPLSLGWGNFVKDHGLQASQELVFTLVADSFFIVREVSKIVVFTA